MDAGARVTGASRALLTDLYELTMACGYWRLGMAERTAVFYLSFRENPFGNPFSLACGLRPAIEMLQEFEFDDDDLDYLGRLNGADGRGLFDAEFLQYLGQLRLVCDVDAVAEGSIVFPHEPLLRVQGPLLQAQILESLLLNVINFQTLVATKAVRICQAAGTGSVIEFGLRRAQGENGALAASRATYIGGCAGTSNVLAGKLFDIPVRGTHAHSWVMTFDTELASFEAYAQALPNNCIFLVDTYDTLQGVANAITTAERLREKGHALIGIRLDSGDLAALSQRARQMLDAAGLRQAVIVASNDVDEYEIESLRRRGARIDVWGVGTRLATAYDQPALGGVYKLSAIRTADGAWDRKLKLSEHPSKVSTPGIPATRRYRDGGWWVGDVIFDAAIGLEEPVVAIDSAGNTLRFPASAEPEELLVPVMRGGELVYRFPTIHETRQRAIDAVAEFRGSWLHRHDKGPYPVGVEQRLFDIKRRLMESASNREGHRTQADTR